MKKIYIFLVLVLTMTLLSTVSCSSGISQELYDKVNNDLGVAQAQVQKLQGDLSTAQTQSQKSQGDLTNAQAQVQKLQSDLSTAQSQTEKLQGELSTAQSQSQKLQVDLTTAQSKMNVAKTKIGIINDIFLPAIRGDFDNYSTADILKIFFGWQDKIKTIGDAALTAKFQAIIESGGGDTETLDFFVYLFESLPKSLD
jgi:DNA repair exonuclease SbcCD ATPase subunit